MNPAALDVLLHDGPDGTHGDRTCPKCGLGFMAYVGRVYSCRRCAWLEFRSPPWPPLTPTPTP